MDSNDLANLVPLVRRENDPYRLNAVISAWERNPDRARELVWIEGEEEEDDDEESAEGEHEVDLDSLRERDEIAAELFVSASIDELENDPDIAVVDEEEEEGDAEEGEDADVEEEGGEEREEERRGEGEARRIYNLRSRRQRRENAVSAAAAAAVSAATLQLPEIIDRDVAIAPHDARDKCICCHERRVYVSFVPCGHSCTCLPCLHRMREQQAYQNATMQCLACGVQVRNVVRIDL